MVPKQQGLQSPVGYTHSAAGEVGTPPRRRKHNAVSRTLYVTRPLPSEEGETTHHLRRRYVCGCTGCRAQSSSRAKSHKTHKAMLTTNTRRGKIVSTTVSTVESTRWCTCSAVKRYENGGNAVQQLELCGALPGRAYVPRPSHTT